MWRSCDGRGDGYTGAVVVLVTDADVDVVAPGTNRTGMGADVEGVEEPDKSGGDGNELGSTLGRRLLSWLYFLPNSPLLSGRSRHFSIEWAGQAETEH